LCRLRCIITDKKQVNVITGHAVKTLANDIRDTWKLFSLKLAPLAGQGSAYKGPAAAAEDIKALLSFYETKGKEVNYINLLASIDIHLIIICIIGVDFIVLIEKQENF
jgi:hypothetical protein